MPAISSAVSVRWARAALAPARSAVTTTKLIVAGENAAALKEQKRYKLHREKSPVVYV